MAREQGPQFRPESETPGLLNIEKIISDIEKEGGSSLEEIINPEALEELADRL